MSGRRDLIGHSYRQRRARAIANSGGICLLCGDAIDLTLSGNHPHGPTLEHVIPVSRGGSPDDPANLSASHRHCNITRGDRLLSEMPRTERPSRRWT